MKLCLIRHADAVPLGDQGITDDADRPLTDKGREQCRALAEAFTRQGIALGTILTSPLLRSRQTVDVILEHRFNPKPEVHVCEGLAPGARPRKLTRSLNGYCEDSVAVVGHMPDLAQLASWLIGSKKAQIHLAKGGAALIECDPGPVKGAGVLLWLVTPQWYNLSGVEVSARA
jgi:phosphohistidine phosphatase